MTSNEDVLALIMTSDIEDEQKVIVDEYLNNSKTEVTHAQQPHPIETTESSKDSIASKEKFAELDQKIENLRDSSDIEIVQIQRQNSLLDEMEQRHREELERAAEKINELHFQQIKSEEQWNTIKTEIDQKYETERQVYEENLRVALEQNMKFTNEIQQKEQKLNELKQIEEGIKTVFYTNIQIELMHDFIVPKFQSFEGYLKQSVPNIDEHFADRIPKLTFAEEYGTFKIILTGLVDHHTIFTAAYKRLTNLSNSYKSSTDFYQRYLNRIIRSISKKLIEVKVKTHSWKQYIKILIDLLQDKSTEYANRFNNSIREKTKSLIEQSIQGISNPPWVELRTYTDDFFERHLFENEINELKSRALDEFIKQNISFQRLKTDRIPTEKSVNTVKYFIEQTKTTLKINPDYQGHEVQQFSLIPTLLQQIMIYYSCFTVQLPLFESCRDLLDLIEINTVTTITTLTGSGKK